MSIFSKKLIVTTVIASSMLSAASAYAIEKKSGIAAKASTLGLGLEASHRIDEQFGVRLGIFGLPTFEDNNPSSPIKGPSIQNKEKYKTQNIPLMFDYYPMSGSGFRVSAGLAYSNYESNLSISTKGPTSSFYTRGGITYYTYEYIKLNNTKYYLDDLGKVNIKTKRKGITPIASVGYEGYITSNKTIGFDADIGLAYLPKQKICVTSTNSTYDDNQKFLNDVKKSMKVRKGNLFPLVSLGIKFNF